MVKSSSIITFSTLSIKARYEGYYLFGNGSTHENVTSKITVASNTYGEGTCIRVVISSSSAISNAKNNATVAIEAIGNLYFS